MVGGEKEEEEKSFLKEEQDCQWCGFFIHFVVLREFRFSDICGNVFMIEDKMEDPRRCWVDHITAQSSLTLCTPESTQPLSSLSLVILLHKWLSHV